MHDGLTGEHLPWKEIFESVFFPEAMNYLDGGIAVQSHVKVTKGDFTMPLSTSQENEPRFRAAS